MRIFCGFIALFKLFMQIRRKWCYGSKRTEIGSLEKKIGKHRCQLGLSKNRSLLLFIYLFIIIIIFIDEKSWFNHFECHFHFCKFLDYSLNSYDMSLHLERIENVTMNLVFHTKCMFGRGDEILFFIIIIFLTLGVWSAFRRYVHID